MKATIREIAERVGVSSASVSLVLNHRDCRISEETRQKIFDTAREIGYVRKKDRIKSKSRYHAAEYQRYSDRWIWQMQPGNRVKEDYFLAFSRV